jgi:oligoendopeptidase F
MEIKKNNRSFVANDLNISTWDSIKVYFENLVQRTIATKEEFIQWLEDKSELAAVIEEDAAWRYIKMTIDTRDEALNEAYTFFVTKIEPELAPYADLLNKKLVASPYFEELNKDEAYSIYFRSVATALKLYREENIALEAELGEKSQQFGAISAAQSIEFNNETITMQKASSLLREPNETTRKEVYEKIAARRSQDIDQLNQLYNELIQLRHQVAQNAGFENYRDYKFQALGRFDYTKEDCFNFHSSIKKLIVPLVKEIQLERLNLLGKTKFKPWDSEVDPTGKAPLKPFNNGKELLDGTIQMFNQLSLPRILLLRFQIL